MMAFKKNLQRAGKKTKVSKAGQTALSSGDRQVSQVVNDAQACPLIHHSY
jgi:hypothetical protein